MSQLATITSKRQLTIPVQIFDDMQFKKGQKVIVSQEDNYLKVEPALNLIEKLSGSVRVPARFKGKSLDQIISLAKKERFSKK